ncbi:hypothetical protein AB0M29_17245 [Streptomyces sp. NPDC051976]|uniref:hypothetical protein n=1 Tax=Streptomyces sp. NPDC051976 TaxID=3154947 RepID=UPI003428C8E2
MATATGHGSPEGTPATATVLGTGTVPGTGAASGTGTGGVPRGADGLLADGADPAVPAGELLAVIGPAGPGRTSLLLALGGRMRLRGGGVAAGQARRPAAGREVRRRVAVARAHGAAAPDPYDRVSELLDLAGVHVGGRAGVHAVGRALAAAGLSVADHPGAGLPGVLARGARFEHLPAADQLLLAVALALVGAPEVLLVDAVDDGQDDAGSHRVWTALRRIADAGTTVIAACADAATAGAFAHRTVLLPHDADDDTAHGAHGGHGRKR